MQHEKQVQWFPGHMAKTRRLLREQLAQVDLAVELVIFRVEDGQDKFEGTRNFKVVKHEGNIVTYHLETKMRDAGIFRYGFRVYPNNPEIPHRQDFAFTRWI